MASDKAYSSQDELMNTNWQDKINQAVAAGDYDSAAKYESARNDKINSSSYTGSQTTTNNYQSSSSSGGSSSSSSSGGSSSSSKTNPNYNAAMKGTGGAVKEGEYTVYYNANGYVTKKVKDGGAGATTTDPNKTASLNQLAASNQYLAAAQQAAQKGDWDAVGVALNNYTTNSVGKDANGQYNMTTANDVLSLLGDVYGYNAEAYYKDKYESVYGEGSWDGTTGTQNAGMQAPGVQAPTIGSGLGTGGTDSVGSTGASSIGGGSLGDYLDQWFAAAKEQQQLAADFAVSQGVNDLTRAEEDAQAQFQTQRNQIAADEAKAKDNQALYAEARGDKGGIGAAQYDTIMNTAAQNRQTVNQAQTKLSTDTARQIADLRAQGEFEKADKLMQLTQQYLSQLMSLEQWALEYQLDIDKFNAQMQQWAAEFELAVSDVTGSYQGMPTLSAIKTQYEMDQDTKKSLASAGETLLGLGIMPSPAQLDAMGLTSTQAQDAITAAQVAAASKASGKGTGGGSSTSPTGYTSIYQTMKDVGIKNYEDAYDYLLQKGYTSTEAESVAGMFTGKIEDGSLYVPAEKTAMQNGTSLDRMDITDSIGNKLILNQESQRDGETKYFVSGVDWLTEQEIIDGLYGGTLDLVFDAKNKNKYFVVEAVSYK